MSQQDSSCSKDYAYPEWEPAYEAAFLESDPEKLLEVIKVAEEQIAKRLHGIPSIEEYAMEHKAILDACQFLSLLRIESTGKTNSPPKSASLSSQTRSHHNNHVL